MHRLDRHSQSGHAMGPTISRWRSSFEVSKARWRDCLLDDSFGWISNADGDAGSMRPRGGAFVVDGEDDWAMPGRLRISEPWKSD